MKSWIPAVLFLTCTSALAGGIDLRLAGCIPGKDVRVALYASASDFSTDTDEAKKALRAKVVKAEGDTVTVTLTDLPSGQYAIAAFVDGNGNKKLDSNFLGIPVEPYGFSRDARNRFKKPGFEEAAFEVGDEKVLQVIHLK